MTQPSMRTDPAVLASGAADFTTQYTTLRAQLVAVTTTVDGLYAGLQGQVTPAVTAAHDRWDAVAQKALTLLDQIAHNVGAAGVDYTVTDEERAAAMNSTGANLA